MWNSRAGKLFIAAAVLVVLIGIAFRFVGSGPKQSSNSPTTLNEIAERRQLSTSTPRSSRESPPSEEGATPAEDELAKFLALKLPREKIEEYLRLHNRDAASLLAAFHASGDAEHMAGDINYLKEAATNFPNDPHVQRTVLAQNAFPEERRKWLDAFKESSPSNSLAGYLSARDYFKSGQPDAAIKEMLAASGKSQFENYGMETMLGEEELYRFSGKSPIEVHEAAMSAMATDLSSELLSFKALSQDIEGLQKQYLTAQDASSAQNLAEMGLVLSARLSGGESAKLVINQLVGIAIEAASLRQLDQNTACDFLGGKTPKERSDELKQQRASMRALMQERNDFFPKMTETERLSFIDRQRLYGELEAARWLRQRYGMTAP